MLPTTAVLTTGSSKELMWYAIVSNTLRNEKNSHTCYPEMWSVRSAVGTTPHS